jgi:hypothetical protein
MAENYNERQTRKPHVNADQALIFNRKIGWEGESNRKILILCIARAIINGSIFLVFMMI